MRIKLTRLLAYYLSADCLVHRTFSDEHADKDLAYDCVPQLFFAQSYLCLVPVLLSLTLLGVKLKS